LTTWIPEQFPAAVTEVTPWSNGSTNCQCTPVPAP
jgi:hypothetical protein